MSTVVLPFGGTVTLSDTLQQLEGSGPAKENRVATLLRRLEGTEDHDVLVASLRNGRPSILTKALRIEYGHDVVTDTSVREYQVKNREVSGL